MDSNSGKATAFTSGTEQRSLVEVCGDGVKHLLATNQLVMMLERLDTSMLLTVISCVDQVRVGRGGK